MLSKIDSLPILPQIGRTFIKHTFPPKPCGILQLPISQNLGDTKP